MLEIKNLEVAVQDKKIIQGLSLTINKGEVHAMIGPNGSGKSTLANALVGKQDYEVDGVVTLSNEDVLSMSVTERSKAGLFLSFQSPPSIPGITNYKLVEHYSTAVKKYKNDILLLRLGLCWEQRDFNDGASGGERKKNELLQLLQASPKLVILDELDTGLDVDALKIILQIIKESKYKYGWLVISHSSKVLKDLDPTVVHILNNGSIVETGGIELLDKVDKQGFKNE
jgi:Fe-S cluster assembly ATP-binding protein|tara:strand:+ start:18 stop:701 length:684 start_codon:yes stop_codon:yes gene_type:complete